MIQACHDGRKLGIRGSVARSTKERLRRLQLDILRGCREIAAKIWWRVVKNTVPQEKYLSKFSDG